jgi:replication factor C small subunit
MFDNLWVEKYRPSTLDDIVISLEHKQALESSSDVGSIPNILLKGKPGIGKTSLAKILVNDVLKCQYMYINASDENGIDTVRTKITNFSQARSLDGNVKVIILDEVDGLTLDAQRALRNTMEEYSKHVRFILTANYEHKVIPALQSRCQSFDMTPTFDAYVTRCEHVLAQENVKHTGVSEFVKGYYPDLRKAINELQRKSSSGEFSPETTQSSDRFVSSIYKLVKNGEALKLRKHVIEAEATFGGDYPGLLISLFNEIEQSSSSPAIKSQSLLIVGEHLYRAAFVLDQEINFYTCLIALSKVS